MKTNRIIVAIFVIATILLMLNTCRLTKRQGKDAATISALQLEKQRLDSLTNKQGETILYQESLITSSTDAIDELTDTIFNLRKKDEKNQQTLAYYKSSNAINLVGVSVPYIDSIAMKEFGDSISAQCKEVIDYYNMNTIPIGMIAEDSTANYKISQTVESGGIKINNLVIPDTLQLRFVEKKGGLFKPSSIQVQFKHSNPLVTTTQANSVFYVPKKKSFFKRVILPVAIGVGAGILIAK